jgi:hypothetical protein
MVITSPSQHGDASCSSPSSVRKILCLRRRVALIMIDRVARRSDGQGDIPVGDERLESS